MNKPDLLNNNGLMSRAKKKIKGDKTLGLLLFVFEEANRRASTSTRAKTIAREMRPIIKCMAAGNFKECLSYIKHVKNSAAANEFEEFAQEFASQASQYASIEPSEKQGDMLRRLWIVVSEVCAAWKTWEEFYHDFEYDSHSVALFTKTAEQYLIALDVIYLVDQERREINVHRKRWVWHLLMKFLSGENRAEEERLLQEVADERLNEGKDYEEAAYSVICHLYNLTPSGETFVRVTSSLIDKGVIPNRFHFLQEKFLAANSETAETA